MPRASYPIIEHDPERPAVIEPSEVLDPIDIAERCVLCFFGDLVLDVAGRDDARVVYELETERRRVAFAQPGVGAPLSAAILEELIALGCRNFVVCGGAGVLDGGLTMGSPWW